MGLFQDKRTGWWIADYYDVAGERHRLKVSRLQREARQTLAMLEGQVARDRLLGVKALKPIGFSDYAKVFIDHAKANIKAWVRYETSLKSLTPFFGKQNLTAITPEMIEGFRKERVLNVKPATVNRDLQVLRRMLNLGMIWGYVRENPVKYVKFLREPTSRIRYLTREEFDRLQVELPGYLRPLVTVAVHTGLRLGELLELSWGDVDRENGFLLVNDPKEKRPAKIPMNETAMATVEELYREAKSVKVFVGARPSPHAHADGRMAVPEGAPARQDP